MTALWIALWSACFALTGTMGDATSSTPWALTTNDVAYDPGSVDFRSLRGNYYDLLDASGNQLQDSQVPVQRGRFWPELHNGSSAFLAGGHSPATRWWPGWAGLRRAASIFSGVGGPPAPRTAPAEVR